MASRGDNPRASGVSSGTLRDFFARFAQIPAEFIEYDNGYRGWKYSYRQVGRAAKRFAARLQEQGIGKGDKVIFWCENRAEWVAAFWGCVLTGAVVVPIDYRASDRFLRRIAEVVSARLIVIGEEVQLPGWEGQAAVWPLAEMEWPAEECPTPEVEISRDDVVEIVFTSGATGEPKGVVVTHRNILADVASPEAIISRYAKWFRPVFPLRFLCLIPLSHMFGQILTLFIVPLLPGAAVFMRGYSAAEIVHQIRTRRISVVVAVPKILDVLRKYIEKRFATGAERPPTRPHWMARWWRHRRVHAFLGWKFWAFVVGAAALTREQEGFWLDLGVAVVQGYGLTETAPVVAFNNPFQTEEGTVGTPVAGAEVRIAPDGEILVRGDIVTPGYYRGSSEDGAAFAEGWFHTGDLGHLDAGGNLVIRGRKKEMIVTPEGLNVFPEDVERVLDRVPGVRESAVVGRERVEAVVVLEDSGDPNEIVRQANSQLEDYQKIRSILVWPGNRLPRTESTQKLKHAEIQRWVDNGAEVGSAARESGGGVIDLVRKYAPGREIRAETTLGELGLSSLDRVELLMDLEQHLDRTIDESQLTGDQTVAGLGEASKARPAPEFPAWNRGAVARWIRSVALWAVWLPFTRIFAHVRVSGREHLAGLQGPVIFAPNHQSHLDTPVILSVLPARFRFGTAVAMWKEYFGGHFYPEGHSRYQRIRDALLYWLAALFFNGFPLPQTESGARESLRYAGDLVEDKWSVLFFPEGERTEAGEIKPFQRGIGLLAGHLHVAVVPVRLRGVEKVLHRGWGWPRPGKVEVTFGAPLRLKGNDYAALTKEIEEAVRAL